MTNEEAINVLTLHKENWERLIREHIAEKQEGNEMVEALSKAIEALYRFEHVIVKCPDYGDKEFDAWIDRKRCLLFIDSITFEGVRLLGWEWRTENEQ